MVEKKIGERTVLMLQDGTTVEGIVRSIYEDDEAISVSYIIPEMDDYKTGEFYYPKGVGDTSGIEARTNMPKDYSGKTLGDFRWDFYHEDTSTQKKVVDGFLYRFDTFLRDNLGLYIHSKTRGSGKTLLACCIGNEIIQRRGLNVKFVSITDYLQAVKDKAAERFSGATVLILDDIGAQDGSKEWINEAVYQLINHRYEKALITIFTSNAPILECAKDDRVISRVEQMGWELKIPETPVRSKRAQIRKMRMMESILEEK